MYPELTEDQVTYVCETLQTILSDKTLAAV